MAAEQDYRSDDLTAFTRVRNCTQIILGRFPLGPHEVRHYSGETTSELLRFFSANAEFRVEVELPLVTGGSSNSQRFIGEPSLRLCEWVSAEVPLTNESRTRVRQAENWRDLITAIWTDSEFQANLDPTQFSRERIQSLTRSLQGKASKKLLTAKHGQTRSVKVIDNSAILMEVPTTEAELAKFSPRTRVRDISRLIHLKRERNRFYSITADPQIYMSGIPSGRYEARFNFKYQKTKAAYNDDYFQIFFDFGDGYTEERSAKYSLTSNEMDLILYLDLRRPVVEFRLDPTTRKVSFTIENLSIQSIGHIDVLSRSVGE